MTHPVTTYTVRVHQEPGELLWAEITELPGCFASGADLAELFEAVGEAITMVLQDDARPPAPAATCPAEISEQARHRPLPQWRHTDLQKLARTRGISDAGTRLELLERIQSAEDEAGYAALAAERAGASARARAIARRRKPSWADEP